MVGCYRPIFIKRIRFQWILLMDVMLQGRYGVPYKKIRGFSYSHAELTLAAATGVNRVNDARSVNSTLQ